MNHGFLSTVPKPNNKVWSDTSNLPHLKKARISKLKIKSMLICFFGTQGVVHTVFVHQGPTINKQYYREVLDSEKRVHHVWPDIADTWIQHHDNAPCHTAISVKEFLTKKGIPVVPQPPY